MVDLWSPWVFIEGWDKGVLSPLSLYHRGGHPNKVIKDAVVRRHVQNISLLDRQFQQVTLIHKQCFTCYKSQERVCTQYCGDLRNSKLLLG